jgi:hypothetical protein
VTLYSAAETSSVGRVSIPARRNEITPYFGDDGQAFVRRLWGSSRGVVFERPLSTTAPPSTAAAADVAFFQRGAIHVIAQKRYFFILVAAGFKGLIFARPDRHNLLDDRRDLGYRFH